jgi:ribulose-phosphate 3-epimerase
MNLKILSNNYKNIGIGILPTTNINSLIPYLEFTSTVLLLAVNPGFSNQSKVVDLRQRIEELNNIQTNENTVILVDGGVSNEDLIQLQENGVDIAVQGGAIFG